MCRASQLPFLPLLFCILMGFVFLPSRCWSIYYFEDQFTDGRFTDKWTVATSGQASIRESGTLLDVAMTAQPGSCTAAVVKQKQSFDYPCSMDATVVLRPAAGVSTGVKVMKDASNFVELVIGPDDVVIRNVESGTLASRVAGSAAAYVGKETTVQISAFEDDSLYLSINGVAKAEVLNVQLGSSGLSLALTNSFCPAVASTAHVYYDSVMIKTSFCFISQRVSGRVTDSKTGQGISFAEVTSDVGGGLTSPNGYYMIGAGMETSLNILVAAEGYSPDWGTVAISDLVNIKDWSLKPVCPAAISTQGAAFSPAGGSGSISLAMTPQAGCGMYWLAESSAAWIYLPGGSGIVSGNKTVSYIVASNSGADPRIGTISLAGRTFRIVQQGTQQMAVPSAAQAFYYAPSADPVMDVNPSGARPFASGNLQGGEVDMNVGLPGFTAPVDIYLGFKMPDELSQEIWIIMPDLSAQPASRTVAPWKTAVTGPIYDGLYDRFPISMLPAGVYDLYTLVTPAGRLDAFYLWITHFTAP